MFDPVRICMILNEAGVDYVVVGGFAAVVRGSSLPTRDIDIVPSRSSENLDRLKDEIYRVCYLVSQAGPVAGEGRPISALSKQRDFAISQEVLRGFGDLVKDAISEQKQVINELERYIHG